MNFKPQLRFPEFSGEWEEKKLGEVSFLNPKSDSLPDKFIYIDLDSVESGLLKKKKVIFKNDAPSRAQRVLENFDILYQTVRPYQKNNYFFSLKDSEKYVASTGYAQIRAKDDSKFLYYAMHTERFVNEVLANCTGTSYPAINSKDLGKIKLRITSVMEQEKIASFLSKVDSKIDLLEKKQELWETYKKGIMKQIFSQKLRFKDENGEDYPDWEEKKLGKISDIKTGSKDLKDKDDNGIYPFFVRSNNVEQINSYSYDGEAILIPGDGVNVGKIYHYIKGKFDYHQRVYKISDFSDNFLGKYIYYYLKQNFLRQAKKNSLKASVDSLRLPTIKEMEINYPELSEQRKIINFLSTIDKKIGNLNKELEINKEFKKGLLQQMFC